MKKVIILVMLTMFLLMPILAKTVTIDGISKPAMMVIEDNRLYVLEKTTIYIYSLKDFKLIKKFGRAGEGPGEFMARPFGAPMSMSFVDDKLVVNSNNKLTYLTKDGKYISERRALPNLVLFQVKDNFAAIGPAFDKDKKMMLSFQLFSNELKKMKLLFQSNLSVNPQDNYLLPTSAIVYNPVYKNKIIVAASNEDFLIDIYDFKGNKINSIKKDYKKRKFTEKDKKYIMDWFKNRSPFKKFFDNIKQFIKFKTHYPAMRDIKMANEKLYVITYKQKGDLWECIILDMKGKELNRVFVPLDEYIPFTYYNLLFAVEKNKIYSFIEDVDEEVWKLHITEIK